MSGKFERTVLVTGGTSGLGYQCALKIAREHPTYLVVVSARSDKDGAVESLNSTLKQSNVVFMPLDLSNLANVRSFAAQWELKQFPAIHSLVLNAALQFPDGIQYSDDGFEKTFAISHVGHALLLFLLRKYLADTARIAVVSSGTHDPAQKSGLPDAHYVSAEQLAHPTPEIIQKSGRQHYSNSKLANILFTYRLDRQFQDINKRLGKHWTINAFDPGLMPGTGLAREAGPVLAFVWHNIFPKIRWLLNLFMNNNVHTPEESGSSLARLVIGSDLEKTSGQYFEGRKPIKSSTESYDEKKQEDLWQWTINTLAKDEAEKRSFHMTEE
ncbi:putative short-chain dehydrogenase [Stachybotrys elegans]|uniref:Short-chain dehydrogenase n=1 Tax=Stachybotrys elegans TaxID=80388 RepID=A0A8K0SPA1_9HYPO|nr:putative short-chain dehydrogenase [Stachybotrys elegans]